MPLPSRSPMPSLSALVAVPVLVASLAGPVRAQGVAARTAALPGRSGRIERDCGSAADSTMRFRRSVGDSAVSVAAPPPAGTQPITGGTRRSHEYPEYDVVLDVPNLCVQNIRLKVDTLTAKINLDARISNLVRVTAGADVFVGDVDLTIRGVRAQALLLVDLDDIYHVVDQTLTFVDNHPEVVDQLTSTLATVGGAVGGTVGGVLGSVQGLLLGSSRDASGQLVQRLVDQATGRIVERTLSAAGKAVAERTVGTLLDLPVVRETAGAAGTVVRQVRDSAGKLVEFTLNTATRAISNVRLP